MKLKHISVLSCLLTLFIVSEAVSLTGAAAAAKAGKGKAKVAKKVTPYPPEFNDAVRLVLYDKKYKDAYDIFDKLDRNGFCRDKTHYYMALCFHNMNQLQQAAQHYQVVYNFSKDPQLRYMAAVGYGQVSKYAKNRTYSGQGNLFARLSTGGSNAAGPWGGGGGAADCGPSG